MKYNNLTKIACCIIAGLMLTACNSKDDVVSMGTEEDIEFTIESEETEPNFDESVGGLGEEGQPMYEIDGDYAYELDHTTLERVSGPLDPVTHEEVSVEEDTNNTTTETEAPSLEVDNQTPEDSTTTSNVTEETEEEETTAIIESNDYNKLPNTGIFLEDD